MWQSKSLRGNKDLASAAFNACVNPLVACTDPEVAWVGLTETTPRIDLLLTRK